MAIRSRQWLLENPIPSRYVQYATYTVDTDGKKVTKTVEGDWSAPSAAFTVDALQPITDLQYVKADDEYYYFTYSAKVDLDSVWYQIATGTEFTTATMVSDWSSFYYDGSAGSAKLKISKNTVIWKQEKPIMFVQ